MKVLKKNQVILFVVALMLVAAGYLNYTNTNTDTQNLVSTSTKPENELAAVGDAKLVNSGEVVEAKNEINEKIQNEAEKNQTAGNENAKNTNNTTNQANATAKDEYFSTSRLGRDTMYSQMIESYQKILDNTNISEQQKSIATQEITNINNTKNSIMISENLIKTKGIEDVVIFVNDKSISVVAKGENLEQDKIAQIQNIVAREMKAEIENIHISNK